MRIMRDVIGSQKLIPCTLIILTFVLIRSVPDIAYTTVQTVYSTAYRDVSLQVLQKSGPVFLPHCLIRKVPCQITYLQRHPSSVAGLRKQTKRF